MKRSDYQTRLLVVLGSVGLVCAGFLFGQGRTSARRPAGRDTKEAVQVRIKRLKGLGRDNLQRTPEYKSDAYRGRKKAGEWVEVRTEYDTGGADWADELVFSYYVMCKSKDKVDGKNAYNLYRRVVKYVDVERDQGHNSCVYLRPNTVERHGEPVAIAVVVSSNGEVVAQESETAIKLPDDWWENEAVLESKTVTVTIRDGQLLTRDESPWALISMDDYEWIKKE